MRENHLWNRARAVKIQKTYDILDGFTVGFDGKIPEDVKDALMRFVYWAEDNFAFPVTLWVDFKYNHYLLRRDGKRVGYLFYWADFKDYPVFDNPDDIPVIQLPVRTERRNMEEILRSFIGAISAYYMWLTDEISGKTAPDAEEVEEVLQLYIRERMTHQMNLHPGPFAAIASGCKTIELRLRDPKRSNIRVGDRIVFTDRESGKELTARVTALHRFGNFAELYASLPLEKCGYLPEELATASPKDMEVYYTPAQQAEHGVLGIEIRVINEQEEKQ